MTRSILLSVLNKSKYNYKIVTADNIETITIKLTRSIQALIRFNLDSEKVIECKILG